MNEINPQNRQNQYSQEQYQQGQYQPVQQNQYYQQPQYNQQPPKKKKKPIYKEWWFWIITSSGISDIQDDTQESSETTEEGTTKETTTKVTTTKETTTKKKIPTEYISAVRTAQSYSDNMYMSKQGIYDQLTSDHGEQFSKEAAKYAIEHIDADWNYNANGNVASGYSRPAYIKLWRKIH